MAETKRYLLRDIPPDLWRQFKVMAAADGRPLRSILIDLIRGYCTARAPR